MERRQWQENANDTLEKPVMCELIGEVNGKKMLDLAAGTPDSQGICLRWAAPPAPLPFADASDIPAWAESALRASAAKGIAKGYPDGAFRPHQPVSREQMAAMLARAARALTADGALPDERQTAAAAGRFADAPAIAAWARGDVGLAATQGWMQGRGDGRFDPHANATRAEAAATLLRLWESLRP